MFALARTAARELIYFEFGEPVDPRLPIEARVRWILADFASRREVYLDGSVSQAVVLLINMLSEAGDDPNRLIPILRSLGFLRSANGADAVAGYLNHPLPEIQREAILAIGRIGSLEHLPRLEPFLKSPDRELRRAAIVALSKSIEPEIFPRLEAAAGPDPELQAIVQHGRRRLEALERKDMRAFALVVLESEEYEDLMRLLEITAGEVLDIMLDRQLPVIVRVRAVRVAGLVHLRRAGPPIAAILAEDTEPLDLRKEAAAAAGRCKAKSAVPSLIRLLDSTDAELQDAAITALGKLEDPQALGPLLSHWNVREGAARQRTRVAIRRLGSVPGSESLMRLLRSKARWSPVGLYIITDDLRLRPDYRQGILDAALTSANPEARRDAILLLAFVGERAEASKLVPLIEDADPTNRELATAAYEKLRAP